MSIADIKDRIEVEKANLETMKINHAISPLEDIQRLGTIASRFSKIGSKPRMEPADAAAIARGAADYMATRISPRISFTTHITDRELPVSACAPLLEWVMENLIKNAVDAMEVTAVTLDGKQRISLNHLWERRQSTKFNGTSYISQRAAAAIYTPEGKRQVRDTIAYYMRNAELMCESLTQMGFEVFGGRNAPYLWVKTPHAIDSWRFFEQMLYAVGVVCTPGVGFGPSGEGYVRLTAFGKREDCEEAMQRIGEWVRSTH